MDDDFWISLIAKFVIYEFCTLTESLDEIKKQKSVFRK